jgi:diguanylate cyclase (GGDEF)-like protein
MHRVDDPLEGVDRVGYESDTAWALLPASLCLSGAFLAFTVLHHLSGGPRPSPLMDVLALGATLVTVAVAWFAWRGRIPERLAHAAMALLGAVTTVNVTAHLMLSGDADETVGLLLLMAGIGVVLLRRAWLLPAMAGIWLAWLVAVVHLGGGLEVWGQWAFYLVAATVLGSVVVALRRRSIDVASAALREAMRAATEDPATNLSNRRGLAMLSRELVEIGRRRHEIVHCTFLDVDGLKRVNDERGHDAGDRVIVAVAEAVRATTRAGDVVARWGGDEFVVVGLGASEGTHDLEDRVAAYLAANYAGDSTLAGLHISVGRAEIAPWEDGDTESLLWKADHDMYERRAERAERAERAGRAGRAEQGRRGVRSGPPAPSAEQPLASTPVAPPVE